VYKAHGLPAIADGPLVSDAVQGLKGLQVPIEEEELRDRTALPAQAAFNIFERAEYCMNLYHQLNSQTSAPVSTPEDLPCEVCGSAAETPPMLLCDDCDRGYHISCLTPKLDEVPEGDWLCPVCANQAPRVLEQWRDCLATVVSYQYFNRADTTHGVLTQHLSVDPPTVADPQIRLIPLSLKGKKRGLKRKIRAVCVPVSQCPRLANLLTGFKAARDLAFESFGCPAPDYLWALPGELPGKWTSQIQTDWLTSACSQTGITPPPGEKYASHSLRSGAASAANAIGVPMAQIKWYGHWSKTSDVVEGRYIDPTFRPSDAARFFFGWLRVG
jgi:hypothetical protein